MFQHYDPDRNCLTKAEIARFLRISQRQAARLMMTMNTIAIGQNQRRVLRKDFDEWLDGEREVITALAECTRGPRKAQPSYRRNRDLTSKTGQGSVATLAAKLREEKRAKKVGSK